MVGGWEVAVGDLEFEPDRTGNGQQLKSSTAMGPARDATLPPPPPPRFAASGTAMRHDSPRWLSRGLSDWLHGLMWIAAVIATVPGFLAWLALTAFTDYADAPPGSASERTKFADWLRLDEAVGNYAAVALLAWLPVFVLVLVWMNKAHKATQDLWPGRRTWSSGWTIGGWFIPAANLVIPRLVVSEIEAIATAPRAGDMAEPNWQKRPRLITGWIWWLGLVAGAVLQSAASGVLDSRDTLVDRSDFESFYSLRGLGFGVWALSCACGAQYFRRLGRRLAAPDDDDDEFSVMVDEDAQVPRTTSSPIEVDADDTIEVGYTSQDWLREEFDDIRSQLMERGVRFRMEQGVLYVDKGAEGVADRVIRDVTGEWPS